MSFCMKKICFPIKLAKSGKCQMAKRALFWHVASHTCICVGLYVHQLYHVIFDKNMSLN